MEKDILLLAQNTKFKNTEEKAIRKKLIDIWENQVNEDKNPGLLIQKQKLWRIYHDQALPVIEKDMEDLRRAAQDVRKHFDVLVIVGIGGSDLGARALHQALNRGDAFNELSKEARGGAPKIYFLSTFSDEDIQNLIDRIETSKISWLRVAFNVISKSGTTPETFANFSIIQNILKQKIGDAYPQHIIATTGIELTEQLQPKPMEYQTSSLYREASEQHYRHILRVPEGIGGRFSVFTPVGLFYAAVAGLDLDQILKGLSEGRAETNLNPGAGKNTAYEFAKIAYLADTQKKIPILLMNLWGPELEHIGKWFRQLWAESLGKEVEVIHYYEGKRKVLEERFSAGVLFKRTVLKKGNLPAKLKKVREIIHAGSVPMTSIGSADNHSIAQQIQKGVRNILVVFVGVRNRPARYKIPSVRDPKLNYLSGKSMAELMEKAMLGTEIAYTHDGVSNIRFELKQMNTKTLAKFLYILETATAVAGELYGVNAFDQPGVEDYKKATAALLRSA